MESLLALHIEGTLMVCRHTPGGAIPLAPTPGMTDATAFQEPGSRRVVIMDSGKKRAGLFELLDEEPWIKRVLPFATLPKDCHGDVALAVGEGMVVGGHSKSGESLWWRHPTQAVDRWTPLNLPKEIKRPGKSIDGLHQDGRRLIAVDDVVAPRWLILYRLEDDESLALEKKVLLPAHFPYERIVDSHLGEKTLWLVSRGMRRGQGAAFVWGVDRDKFVERGFWPAVFSWPVVQRPASPFLLDGEELEEKDEEDDFSGAPMLFHARRVVECGGLLLVACQAKGLLAIPLERKRTNFKQTDPRQVPISGLESVEAICTLPGADGVYLIGARKAGDLTSVFLPIDEINEGLRPEAVVGG